MNSSDDHVDLCNGDKTLDNYHDGDDGDDGDGDGDGDGDIYIMVKCLSVCLSVTKNHHFLLGVSCNRL